MEFTEERKQKGNQKDEKETFSTIGGEKYSIIYADPPWLYRSAVFPRMNNLPYVCMELKDMKKLKIESISSRNCLLFLWVTNCMLQKGIELMNSWGFVFKTVAFVWDKQKVTPGSYTMSQTELCLVGKKGIIPKPFEKRNIRQFLSSPRKNHSAKPAEIRNRITQMFPKLRKIELFSRNKVPGWDCWGLEVESSIEIPSS